MKTLSPTCLTRRWATLAVALLVAVAALTPSLVLADEPDGDSWLEWRGPTRDGKFYGPKWPDDLSEEHLKQMWKVDLAKATRVLS